jgi:uncharacterized protein with ParB-like and HNH nuclease domain
MQASETRVQELIEGTKQYLVPLFQRAYSWEKKEWRTLWQDIWDLCQSENPRPHFMGSVVTLPTVSVPEGVAKYLLIDGQQRMTTTFILLALVRDLAEASGDSELASEIQNTLLVNQYKKDFDHFKFLPTQVDRPAFISLIKDRVRPDINTQVGAAYAYFEREQKKRPLQLARLKETITSVLSTVSIVLDRNDNPHLVFESLNAKGRALTQADLVRNFFLMRVHVTKQDEVFSKHWDPMQQRLNEKLTDFFRHYLTRHGDVIKIEDIYFKFKDSVSSENAEVTLSELSRFSDFYAKLLNPLSEDSRLIRDGLTKLATLDVGVTYPFLLSCYDDYSAGRIAEAQFASILNTLANFVIRRFVCNVGTYGLNRELAALYKQAKNDTDLVTGVRKSLAARRYPKDAEFRRAFAEISLYGAGERATRAKLILVELERSFDHKEEVDVSSASVEHVMPQTLSEQWKHDLGDGAEDTHELLLHTIGNLTLTSYNQELSNSPFRVKRERLALSNFQLNREIAKNEAWGRKEIEERSERLTDLAMQIWPYFGDGSAIDEEKERSARRRPARLKILGQELEVESWRDVVEQTVVTVAQLEPEKLPVLAEKFPKYVSKDQSVFRGSRPIAGGYHIDMWLSADRAQKFCQKVILEIGLSEDEWEVITAN